MMDESWRMRMGFGGSHPCLRPTVVEDDDDTASSSTRRSVDALHPDDFADVFGGPPRTVLSRKFSADFTRSSSNSSFYEEIFRPPDFLSRSNTGGGRSLPAFRIPARGEGFYCDVFGSDQRLESGRMSRERSRPNSKAKSKSNSSSVLSSEELSPLRPPVTGDDVALSSFASKLRPINVPSRWNSATSRHEDPPQSVNKQGTASFPYNYDPSSYPENRCIENDYNENSRSSYYRFSRQLSSPETISLEPNSYRTVKISVEDLELNSPFSPASSLCQEPEAKVDMPYCDVTQEEEEEEEMEQEEDEVMSSYVIEINSDHREGNGEAVSIDEAIAWAKERFQAHSFDRQQNSDEAEEKNSTHELSQQTDGHGRMPSSMEEELKKWKTDDDTEQAKKEMEMELLNKDIKLWSSGKESDIRLLLSTLHHILWPNSGWHAIPITSLIESSHVKKAYQKARLCLHPDKLQQRGATLPQKYVAEKAFSILQDAWAAFISQDVFFN